MKIWKYKIIEYEYRSLIYRDGKKQFEVAKTLHNTNSRLLMYLIILCLKLNHIHYDVIEH